jgi:hypothetical protein
LVGQDSVGLSRRRVGNDVARFFGVRLRLGSRDSQHGGRWCDEFHERRGSLGHQASNRNKRPADQRTQNSYADNSHRPVRRRLLGRLQTVMNEPGRAEQMLEGETSEGDCCSHQRNLEIPPSERVVALRK